MHEGIYRIADCTIRIQSIHPTIHTICADYASDTQPELTITTTQADIDAEREKSALEDQRTNSPIREFPDGYLETLTVHRQLCAALLPRNTLLFHGSVVAVDGQAYLFTAESGTGKSTHTRLWRQLLGDRAVMVNDDKPFLRFTEDQVIACGAPWNGKHRLGENIQVPLKTICILERGAENRIQKISVIEALPMVMQQSMRPKDFAGRKKYMELLDMLMSRVQFYRLQCNMDPEAASVSYNGMKE